MKIKNFIIFGKNKKLLKEISKIQDFDGSNDDGYTIYVLPHSHCDHGWLSSLDEYYHGTVKYIISSFINELKNDEKKTFNWAEVGFFRRWYESSSDSTKELVKKLINNGQLDFVTGGYVQNDEASADLDDIIEQMTQGHLWLKEHLNYTVEYAWQIDPFGYSSITPTLFSKMGLKGLIINRIAYDVKDYMKENLEMEFLWKGSETLNKDSEMLVSALDRHYDYFPKVLDPRNNYTVEERANSFIEYFSKVVKTRNTKTVLYISGDDFRYFNAPKEFRYSRGWMDYIRERKEEYGIKEIRYGTVSDYFKQLKSEILNEKLQLTEIDKDFFPYATDYDEYWTGYFTTRPTMKKQIREFSKLLRFTESIYSLLMLDNKYNQNDQISNDITGARDLLSLAQHHDIVTGTSRSYVLYDYYLKLKNSRLLNFKIISNLYNLFLNNNNNDGNNNNDNNNQDNENYYLYNNFIDIDSLSNNQFYSIKLFNSLGWEINQHYSFRIKSNSKVNIERLKLFDSDLNEIQNIQINSIQYDNQCFNEMDQYILFSIISVPPLGFSTYYITVDSNKSNLNQIYYGTNYHRLKGDIRFSTKEYEYEFSKRDGLLKSVKDLQTKKKDWITQDFQQYKAKKSGPYIFEAGKLEDTLNYPDYYLLFDGPLVSQLSMIYNSDNCSALSIVNQRIYKNKDSATPLFTEQYLETSYSFIGEMNRERVIHYTIDSIKDNKAIYTDNGLEPRKRTHNRFGSTTSNYYPTLHYVYLKNNDANKQFTVYVDRSVGITLRPENKIEIMLHRTIERDDWKGVRWPTIDTSRIDGKLYFNLDSIENQKENEKQLSLKIDHQPIYLIKKISNIKQYQKEYKQSYSGLIKSLPNHIHLLSLKTFSNNNMGLRLLNLGNDNFETKNKLSLNNYFKNFNNLKETGLTFLDIVKSDISDDKIKENYKIDKKFKIKSGQSEYNYNKYQQYNQNNNDDDNNITINPLEIKSYLMKIHEKQNNNLQKIQVNNSIYNNLIYNNEYVHQNNSEIYKDVLNSIYMYDFSVYPLELSHYNDRGRFKPSDKLKKILLASIIPGVSALVLITIIIIVVIRKKKNKKKGGSILEKEKFIKLKDMDEEEHNE
ncbi:hypothetical protein DICPUDRAFT_99980 [Dictyostelium purpureum]|uniref:Alpha-mannosidase n=1 Tax=Dictyostelium purpureum TaxID=5786 RepID=F1A4A7_DICPU|nr:uncharacterized protein DICPUDRAFT_99980 [Dictyostelium purpureum]EGC28973.1 hypothetical protein DICPUDRAFT_99980 [Dictyostelium purpureum]|eukprot:XP_003294502.1 hypothetical protein DICPUDRAFT_99980 [Dictyostelium purpureum]